MRILFTYLAIVLVSDEQYYSIFIFDWYTTLSVKFKTYLALQIFWYVCSALIRLVAYLCVFVFSITIHLLDIIVIKPFLLSNDNKRFQRYSENKNFKFWLHYYTSLKEYLVPPFLNCKPMLMIKDNYIFTHWLNSLYMLGFRHYEDSHQWICLQNLKFLR